MRFAVHKRRQTPAVIIVALIDVLIVMVIFLIVTTTFKQQPALKLALPESTQAQRAGASDNPPVVVFVDQSGSLRLGNDAAPVTTERLRQELRQLLASRTNLTLALSADEKAPFGQIVRVMDISKELGIRTVSAFTRTTAPAAP
jgi:biopolymer transport protein ExbD